jgi:hypothetical protein
LQLAPHVPLPPHAARGVAPEAFGCAGPDTAMQVPAEPETSHAWHCPPHALLQQTPSTQLPDAHSPAAAHAVPFAFLHVPTEPDALQVKPLVAQALSQQRPATQKPLVHALAPPQVLPFATLGTHCPALQ